MNPEESKQSPEVSTGNQLEKFQPEISLLTTALQTLGFVGTKWEHQICANMDELLDFMKRHLNQEDYHKLASCMEVMLRQPLRRNLGRIRGVIRSLEEMKKYLASNHGETR